MPFFSRLEPMMTSLLNGLLGALEKDEREVVSGDLLEAHESPSASVFQVLGLILRRQIIHWADWRPWIVLTTVAIPLGVVLSQTAREFAGWSAVYSWMLVNNTDAALLRNAGFWNGALEYSWTIGKFGIVLFCCSWACGRLIAQFSGRARSRHLNPSLFSGGCMATGVQWYRNRIGHLQEDCGAAGRADLGRVGTRKGLNLLPCPAGKWIKMMEIIGTSTTPLKFCWLKIVPAMSASRGRRLKTPRCTLTSTSHWMGRSNGFFEACRGARQCSSSRSDPARSQSAQEGRAGSSERN
jgi:hypothetical protein